MINPQARIAFWLVVLAWAAMCATAIAVWL
jgi:hypothetical protein